MADGPYSTSSDLAETCESLQLRQDRLSPRLLDATLDIKIGVNDLSVVDDDCVSLRALALVIDPTNAA